MCELQNATTELIRFSGRVELVEYTNTPAVRSILSDWAVMHDSAVEINVVDYLIHRLRPAY